MKRTVCQHQIFHYEALKQVVPEEKLRLIPDPAFTLGAKELPLPEGFAEGNTVGWEPEKNKRLW